MGFTPDKVYLASSTHALTVGFVGGSGVKPLVVTTGVENESGKGPAELGRVEYGNLWPGITLRYDGAEGGIAESTYLVAPGADTSRIRLRYNLPATLQGDGSLRFGVSAGTLSESPPVAWQEVNGKRIPVKVAFRLSDGEVGFHVERHDRTLPLVIDPTYHWHTFYGPYAPASRIAVDGAGNIYVAGVSAQWDDGQVPLHPHSTGTSDDIFVLKLNSEGVYQWHTFYGASSWPEYVNGIALDGSGNVLVTGESKLSWNGDSDTAPLHGVSDGTSTEIFALKLSPNGAYQWHTFYGRKNSSDSGKDVAADGSGNVIVTGSGASWYGPGGEEPVAGYYGGGTIFVLKLAADGSYRWHTFHGGAEATGEAGRGVATDSNGNIFVTGGSNASWNSATGQAPKHSYTGPYSDVFVLKLNPDGAYQWHTFYGGSMGATSIAVDVGSIYVAGSSSTAWNGYNNTAPLHPFSGSTLDTFVLKLNSAGDYQWHTFHNGSNMFSGNTEIAVNGGNIYVAGYAGAGWSGPDGQAPLHPFSGSSSAWGNFTLFKLTGAGEFLWHTFYGAESSVSLGGVAAGGGRVHLAGKSGVSWNGDCGQVPLHPFSGSYSSNLFVLTVPEAGHMVVTTATPVTGITDTAAASGGEVQSGGGSCVTSRGVCRSIATNPTTTDICTSDGTGTGEFTSDINGLSPGTPYHVRAFAVNGAGTAYGADVTFTTASGPMTPPSVTTTAVTGITQSAATGGGNVTADGGAAVTARGVCWGKSANPTIAGSHTTNGSGMGSFTSAISGLSPYTTYHVRAYATNAGGTGYGDDLYFTTLCPGYVAYRGTTGYDTLQGAINGVVGAAEIRAVTGLRPEVVNISGNRTIALLGGYDCVCGEVTGVTTVQGSLTVGGGAAVTLDNMAVY